MVGGQFCTDSAKINVDHLLIWAGLRLNIGLGRFFLPYTHWIPPAPG